MISHSGRKRAALDVKSKPARKRAHPLHDRDYDMLLIATARTFSAVDGRKLFATDAAGLWELYLKNLPAAERQLHNCHCCRKFIENYGSLVAIDEHGRTTPAMWGPDVPDLYGPSFAAMFNRVKTARVTSPFLSKEETWGTPATPGWTHLSVKPSPRALIWRDRLLTAGQKMAANKENYRNVMTALAEFKAPMLDEALHVLRSEALAQAGKFVAPVQWLRDLHDRPKGCAGENVVWRAIADAPEGFCHPRASMAGALLEDIAAGLPFADVKRRFDAKVAPLRYQRPQAPPAAGSIAAAEKIVEKLGIARSLERRFARLDEIETIWVPHEIRTSLRGVVFGHLKAKQESASSLVLPMQTMTWAKFSQSVLPAVERLELKVPSHGRFIALTTAVHADAPPILKWDRAERRNPVAWYVYPDGCAALRWLLSAGVWTKINAVSPLPTLWGDKPMAHISEGVVLVLDGAIDQVNESAALFPVTLRDDLHAIRATIEAHSRASKLQGQSEASACGYDLRKNSTSCHLRALVNGAWQEYKIDRWD